MVRLPGRSSRRRGADLPGEVRAALGLGRGERVLAHARLLDGRWLVATTAALLVVPDGGEGGAEAAERRGWDEVDTATWSETASMLQLKYVGRASAQVVELADDAGFLPEVVRERVEASVVLSRRIDVASRRGVRVAVRRSHPGADLHVQVVPDRGVDVSEPELAEVVAAVAADLREQAGLPPEGSAREGLG